MTWLCYCCEGKFDKEPEICPVCGCDIFELETTHDERLPVPGQILVPRRYSYALKIVKYWKNSNTYYCHRCDLNTDRTPGKQTAFGSNYTLVDLIYVAPGIVKQAENPWDEELFFDVQGEGQMELF